MTCAPSRKTDQTSSGGDPVMGGARLDRATHVAGRFSVVKFFVRVGDPMSESWTTAQAAVILKEPLEHVKSALQREFVVHEIAKEPGPFGRRLSWADLVFLHALPEMKDRLAPQGRAEIYRSLQAVEWTKPGRAGRVHFAGDFHFDFGRHLAQVKAGVKGLQQLHKDVDASGKEPLIRGANIEAYRIAALMDGMSVEEILQDYPSLNARQVLAARAYADAHPKKGRPYPKVSARRSLRKTDAAAEGGGSSAAQP
jgi:uncharacterized protein (DUF433 family)